MEYVFTDAPIVSSRVDRRTPKQSRIAADRRQEKFERFSELFSVEEMVKMGFYSHENKPLPYGIEVWRRHCTLRDESSNHEWYELQVPTLALCLPKMEGLHQVEKLNPMYWEESKSFYWGFKQRSPFVPLYCILDLLNRILNLSQWQEAKSIPLRWKLGNDKVKIFAKKYIEDINNGQFKLKYPPIPNNAVKTLKISYLRHNYTPYDYEWQTGKRSRDEAKQFWDQKIYDHHD